MIAPALVHEMFGTSNKPKILEEFPWEIHEDVPRLLFCV